MFEDIVHSLLNLCLYDVCSLILTEPHTNQIKGVQLRKVTCVREIFPNIGTISIREAHYILIKTLGPHHKLDWMCVGRVQQD